MSEFEEKLNTIFSSPEDMKKIIEMARSLSGSIGKQEENKKDIENKKEQLHSEIDPKMLSLITKLVKEYNTNEHNKTALLSAMKPFVQAENRDALDKAGSILKITQLAKLALFELGGGENE